MATENIEPLSEYKPFVKEGIVVYLLKRLGEYALVSNYTSEGSVANVF
jgi:hypothetical protein